MRTRTIAVAAAMACLGLGGCASHCFEDTAGRTMGFGGDEQLEGLSRAQGGCDGAAQPFRAASVKELSR